MWFPSLSEKKFYGTISGYTFHFSSSGLIASSICVLSGIISEHEGSLTIKMSESTKVGVSFFAMIGCIALLIFFIFGPIENKLLIIPVIISILLVLRIYLGLLFQISSSISSSQFKNIMQVELKKVTT